ADIYALGVLFFLMFVGSFPFESDEVFAHHLHTPPPDPRSVNPTVSPALAAIILRCLAKDRERRFPDVATLKAALLTEI
ncbi:MAG: serine/threonine protein kinase, partial [Myxococcales bacterium]|nr:serine/threonine protein kinase [Myxococcales bacterium]